MKDRFKKFWTDHWDLDEVITYTVGVAAGALSYAIYHKIAYGDNVRGVDHLVYADGHEQILVFLKNGGTRSFHKRLDVA